MRMRYAVRELAYLIPYKLAHALALTFPERHRARNMASRSKMQLSLFDMEQHEFVAD